AAPPPVTCGRTLDVPLQAGTAWRQRVHLARLGDGHWERVPSGRTQVAHFRFPSAGNHRCEVIAFDYGGRVPGAASFTVASAFDLPETLRTDASTSGDTASVDAHPWYPPVRAVPSPEGRTVRLAWRHEGEEDWKTVEPGVGLSVAEIGRGEKTLLFCAEEDGFWRDPSPLRLPVRLTLPLDAYLGALQQTLVTGPEPPDWALRALRACAPEARTRLDELRELAGRRARIEDGLRRLGKPDGGNGR
ncbi:MAG: hypothetical protein PHR35_22060, partial [Kiritimatiellae bacterium]|nr:hypothetical protein [Kiritimatiellia bacterium]